MSRVSRTWIVCGGPIYPLRPAGRVGALLLTAGRVAFAGDLDEARRRAPEGAELLDLDGGTALPGLCDSHLHLTAYALRLRHVDLAGAASLAEALQRVRLAAGAAPGRGWIIGGGWDNDEWGEPKPGRRELDAACPDRPCAMASKDIHSYWVNSPALERAGIGPRTPDPPGGRVVRDESGEPTGLLLEAPAMDLVRRHFDRPGAAGLAAAIEAALPRLHGHGLVAVHSPGEDGDALRALQSLRHDGRLTLRVTVYQPGEHVDRLRELGWASGFGDPWIRLGGVKTFVDGSLGSRTALMLEPYEDGDGRGVAVNPPEYLADLCARAAPAGIAVAIHAIGDRANRVALDALEPVAAESRRLGLRHRVEHVQLIRPEDRERFRALGVVASVQPIHAVSDRYMADRAWGGRSRDAYAYNSLRGLGIPLALGSDAPVESPDPLAGLYAAVTRRRPSEPDSDPWYPGERLPVEAAVAGMTTGAAYAAGLDSPWGTLAPGAPADITVLSHDPFARPPEALLECRARLTMVGGRIVHREQG